MQQIYTFEHYRPAYGCCDPRTENAVVIHRGAFEDNRDNLSPSMVYARDFYAADDAEALSKGEQASALVSATFYGFNEGGCMTTNEQWTSVEDHVANRCKVAPGGAIRCLYCRANNVLATPILIPSQTEEHVPSMMYVTEIIGQTEAKTRAGIEGTTAKVLEAYHCGSRGEVIRRNGIYLDDNMPRVTLASIRETFPRLHAEVVSREIDGIIQTSGEKIAC